jgi:hypothetical protein
MWEKIQIQIIMQQQPAKQMDEHTNIKLDAIFFQEKQEKHNDHNMDIKHTTCIPLPRNSRTNTTTNTQHHFDRTGNSRRTRTSTSRRSQIVGICIHVVSAQEHCRISSDNKTKQTNST